MSVSIQPSVLFPDGTEIFAKSISSVMLPSAGVTVAIGLWQTTSDYSYTFTDKATAYRMYRQILDLCNGILAGQSVLNNNPTNYVITDISPTSFDITTDVVTITGSGFYFPLLGNFHLEDSPGGGTDSNGYYMVCTYVSPTQLTCVFGGTGDGVLGPGAVLLYYEDSVGVQSNVIDGTNPSGTLITIP